MVMMTLDELCAAIRAGKVGTILTFLNDEDARMGKMALSFWGLQQDAERAALCTPAFEEALAPHQGTVARLVYWNDARVCMSPDEHKASYVPCDGGRLGPGQYCEECASMREGCNGIHRRESVATPYRSRCSCIAICCSTSSTV